MKRIFVYGLLGVSFATPVFAQSQGLAEAERAYQSVDFPAAHTAAKRALETGGADREQTARLYVLLGISAAAQGDTEEAKTHFTMALAIKPSLKLEKGISPKVREPYLEAQGYWAASPERLTLSAKPASDRNHLIIQLSDPATLVTKIELRIGAAGVTPRTAFDISPEPTTRFELPAPLRGRSYEYTVRGLDRFGNVLAERGNDADPELVRADSAHANESTTKPSTSAQHGRSYVLPITLGVAGLGALGAAVAFQLKREHAAQDWNSSSCEQPGQTRIQQCQEVDDRRQKYEHLAIGFYAASGALLTGSIIALIAGQPATGQSPRAGLTGCGVAWSMMSCEGRF